MKELSNFIESTMLVLGTLIVFVEFNIYESSPPTQGEIHTLTIILLCIAVEFQIGFYLHLMRLFFIAWKKTPPRNWKKSARPTFLLALIPIYGIYWQIRMYYAWLSHHNSLSGGQKIVPASLAFGFLSCSPFFLPFGYTVNRSFFYRVFEIAEDEVPTVMAIEDSRDPSSSNESDLPDGWEKIPTVSLARLPQTFMGWIFGALSISSILARLRENWAKHLGKWVSSYNEFITNVAAFLFGWFPFKQFELSSLEAHLLTLTLVISATNDRLDARAKGQSNYPVHPLVRTMILLFVWGFVGLILPNNFSIALFIFGVGFNAIRNIGLVASSSTVERVIGRVYVKEFLMMFAIVIAIVIVNRSVS